jgi:hypothetical protein
MDPLATVNVCVSVPAPMTGATGWRWALTDGNPVGREAVFRGADLETVLTAYGAVVAQSTAVRGAPRFRLSAHGRFTGRVLGMAEYVWHPKARVFVPAAPPVVLWPEPEDLPPELHALAQSAAAVAEGPWWAHGADVGSLRDVD